jgi:hypothetical protein
MATVLHSNSNQILFSERYFARLEPTDGKQELLRRAFETKGVVLVRDALDPSDILHLRKLYFSLFPSSVFRPGTDRTEGIFSGVYPGELPAHGAPDHPAHEFVRSAAFNDFAQTPQLIALAEQILDSPVRRLRRTPIRHFTKARKIASRAHADRTYLDRGTPDVVTFWIPVGPCPLLAGGPVYLEDSEAIELAGLRTSLPGSSTLDARPITGDLMALADRTAKRWLWTDLEAGDLLIHSPRIIHATLNTQTDMMRVSTDIRFIRRNAPMDPRWTGDWSGDDGY